MEKKSRSPKNGPPQDYQHFGKKYPAVALQSAPDPVADVLDGVI
jgi:hypothetical protein